ncbi:hypothetical protein ACPV52_09950 [Vibrio astriarenae]
MSFSNQLSKEANDIFDIDALFKEALKSFKCPTHAQTPTVKFLDDKVHIDGCCDFACEQALEIINKSSF